MGYDVITDTSKVSHCFKKLERLQCNQLSHHV